MFRKKKQKTESNIQVHQVNATKPSAAPRRRRILLVSSFIFIISLLSVGLFINLNSPEIAEEVKNTPVELLTGEDLEAVANQSIDPSNADAVERKAIALTELNRTEEAVKVYELARSSGAGNFELTMNEALAVFNTGDYDGSIALLAKAKEELASSSAGDNEKQTMSERIDKKIKEIEAIKEMEQ
jgi:tetratricopeptide (TPR) repeat protein